MSDPLKPKQVVRARFKNEGDYLTVDLNNTRESNGAKFVFIEYWKMGAGWIPMSAIDILPDKEPACQKP